MRSDLQRDFSTNRGVAIIDVLADLAGFAPAPLSASRLGSLRSCAHLRMAKLYAVEFSKSKLGLKLKCPLRIKSLFHSPLQFLFISLPWFVDEKTGRP